LPVEEDGRTGGGGREREREGESELEGSTPGASFLQPGRRTFSDLHREQALRPQRIKCIWSATNRAEEEGSTRSRAEEGGEEEEAWSSHFRFFGSL